MLQTFSQFALVPAAIQLQVLSASSFSQISHILYTNLNPEQRPDKNWIAESVAFVEV